MIARVAARRLFAIGCCVMLTVTGCAFHGLNSLPLPGAVGRGPGANIYHVEIPNVGTMESNSPVMINDVVDHHRRIRLHRTDIRDLDVVDVGSRAASDGAGQG